MSTVVGSVQFWDAPNQNQVMTVDDVEMVIADIQSDFSKGGHTLHYVE
ncbi:hypothetical protein HHA33_25940 (plasmid) [Phytobacter diazotrophicus]|nr:Imm74 family immunity protein [Phytobacter diazotrophicus]QJF20031.1 hypothetical protein HHA33_25940 [Phytobacter diazotrophicus]